MAALTSTDQFLEVLRKSKLVDEKRLDSVLASLPDGLPEKPKTLAEQLYRQGVLTHFQASQLLQGKWRGYLIAGGKYKLLELLGVGGMGCVYLCEHLRMKRLVAIKVLPGEKLDDPTTLERFEREARAVAALDHPNIVRAHDLDSDGKMHFLVMEFVDGTSLQDVVKRFGPMDIVRAAHYVSQCAEGLQHAYETAGLVHRDIKPGNILVDRAGTVKILDMGLARFFRAVDVDPLTKRYEKDAVLGTADYLAPEQAVNSSEVDIRADIYGLGATFYYLLTGRSPFDEGSVAEKLIWHQMKNPEPVRSLRPEVPVELEAVLNKMMAKKPVHRYQEPAAVVDALRPWTERPIEPPADEEMPRRCPALENYSPSGVSLPTSSVSGNLSGIRRPVRSGPRSASHSRASMPRIPAPISSSRPRWMYVAAVAIGLLVVGGGVAYWATRPSVPPKTPATPTVKVPAVPVSPVEPPPIPPTPPLTPPPSTEDKLIVSRGGEAGRSDVYASIALAMAAAKPGQTIVVMESVIEEQLRLDGRKFAGIRIESGLPGGQRPTWKPPADLAADQPLLDLTEPTGIVLKGFALDGGKRINTLIRANGSAGGLTLDDLTMTDALQAPIVFDGCTSSKDKPVVIQGSRIETIRNYAQGDNLDVDANADAVRPAAVLAAGEAADVLHLAIRECRIEGLFKAGVRLEVPCEVEIKLNRVYTLKTEKRPKSVATCDAVSVKVPTAGPVKLLIASNTVARYSGLLRLDRVPATDSGSKFELRSNLMIGGDAFVAAPAGANATAAKALFAGSLGNVARPRTCDGGLKVVDKVEVSFGYIDVNLSSSVFLIYKKAGDTLPLFTSGAGGEPAGVPPKD
ncbi:MAG: serine/threonine-protein kinase [Gemmataceae bacterium]